MSEVTSYLPGFLAAYAVLVVGASSPGPSVAMLIGIAVGQGRTPALVATLGIAVGSMTINILTILGVGILLSQAAWAMSALRVLGALYLAYLAYGAFKRAGKPPSLQPVETKSKSLVKQFLGGYLLQVSNPKAIAFWLAVASVGAVEGAGLGVIVLFVAGGFIISFGCHAAWAVALSVNSVRNAYVAKRRWIETMLGGVFSFAAVKLAVSSGS